MLSDGSATIDPWIAALRAHMMPDGIEHALADADLALTELSPESVWRPTAHLSRGIAAALLGASAHATDDLTATIELGRAAGAVEEVYWRTRSSRCWRPGAEPGATHAHRHRRRRCSSRAPGWATTRRARSRTRRLRVSRSTRRRHQDARAALARAHRLRPLLDEGIPWLTIGVGLELTRAHLALGEVNAARTALDETERVLELRPQMGSLVADARELRDRIARAPGHPAPGR